MVARTLGPPTAGGFVCTGGRSAHRLGPARGLGLAGGSEIGRPAGPPVQGGGWRGESVRAGFEAKASGDNESIARKVPRFTGGFRPSGS